MSDEIWIWEVKQKGKIIGQGLTSSQRLARFEVARVLGTTAELDAPARAIIKLQDAPTIIGLQNKPS